MVSPLKDKKPALLPAPNSDFYGLIETLPTEELAVVKQVRTFMETKIAPIIPSTGSKMLSHSKSCRR
jgi:hypothetical protein